MNCGAAGHEEEVAAKTGLILDPYFSGTKIAWILDHVAGAANAAEKGALACGTIECFLLWRLTGGKVHASDATNASRSLLLDIHTRRLGCGPSEADRRAARRCCRRSSIARASWASPRADILGAPVPVLGMAGDQQAATSGRPASSPAW